MNTQQLDAISDIVGEAISEAVAPLQKRIGELEAKAEKPIDVVAEIQRAVAAAVAALPAPKDGKDAALPDMKAMVDEAVKAIPVPSNGKDGTNGKDGVNGEHGKSVTMDDVQPLIEQALTSIRTKADTEVKEAIKAIPTPKDGKDGTNGKDGINGSSVTVKDVEGLIKDEVRNWTEGLPVPKDGANGKDGDRGEKGSDGFGLAGAMIDRDGALQITLTNGEVKSLGPVVGKDGTHGKDGIGFESFELEYIPESHEIAVKASASGRVKELRYPAGGIRPAGYWRDGVKAKAAEAWVHDGSLWIATKDTGTKPEAAGTDWVIAARKGRDGERGAKGGDGSPPAPIKLKD